jgi:pyruvate dehydrogenase E2 component (dihydrolipoamide acetyltransferase)
MAIEITMPKLSDTMEEGTILKWRVKKGDRVERGDIIAEVETDKAAMEMEAFEAGVVSELKVEENDTVEVGTVIAVLEAEGEKAEEEKAEEEKAEEEKAEEEKAEEEKAEEGKAEEEKAEEEKAEEEKAEEEKVEEEKAERETMPGGRKPVVSPAARRLAREKGVDLSTLRGSGPGGRVVLTDVQKAAAGEAPVRKAEKAIPGGGKSVKIRRIVARKMAEAWQTIPHFFVTVAVDMTDVIRFRQDLGVTINDFILAAVTRSLVEHPWVNSYWIDGEAMEQESVNIALAVATDRGLYNPVLRDCQTLSLRQISARAAELAEKAHDGKLNQEDLDGGTFTISNMGMLGVESFSAIITPPQAAVLAVGTVKGEVVVDDQGEPGIAPILRMTLSADHRILDGADAAEFLTTLKSYLEAPVTLVAGDTGKEQD